MEKNERGGKIRIEKQDYQSCSFGIKFICRKKLLINEEKV